MFFNCINWFFLKVFLYFHKILTNLMHDLKMTKSNYSAPLQQRRHWLMIMVRVIKRCQIYLHFFFCSSYVENVITIFNFRNIYPAIYTLIKLFLKLRKHYGVIMPRFWNLLNRKIHFVLKIVVLEHGTSQFYQILREI